MNRRLLILVLAALSPTIAWSEGTADLSTPRRALRYFIDAAGTGDYAAAATVLDTSALPPTSRVDAGAHLARQLMFVLDAQLWLDWDKITDAPEGDPAQGEGVDVVGTIPLDGVRVPIRIVRGAAGQWHLGPGVVAAIPSLYATYGPGWLGDHLPVVLFSIRFFEIQAWQWLGLAIAVAFGLLMGGGVGALLHRVALHIAKRTRAAWDDLLVAAISRPTRLLIGLGSFYLIEQWLRLVVPVRQSIDRLLRVLAIAAITWAVLRCLTFVATVMADRLGRGSVPLAARGAVTQVMVLKRVLGVITLFFGAASILMQFNGMRVLGTSLLASAGVAGLVIGLAAQRSIGTLLAGIQISFTQPLRVGDVVVIEGEWGTIEEITLTYVVVKIWDLRRLVVPITKILEASFQNWTRSSSEIMGTVFLHADYSVPVELVRAELTNFVKTQSNWDGKVIGLQVTEATDKTLQLRALVSSADASKNWDLRCAVREHLVTFLQALEGGRYLPRTRVAGSLEVEHRG